jgi:hypothetical protein
MDDWEYLIRLGGMGVMLLVVLFVLALYMDIYLSRKDDE